MLPYRRLATGRHRYANSARTWPARSVPARLPDALASVWEIENHVLNPVVMSKTVRINPLAVFIAVLVSASLGNLVGGIFGGFVAALLAIPTAGALQVLVREVWQATAPDRPQEISAPAVGPADKLLGNTVTVSPNTDPIQPSGPEDLN